MRKVFRLLQKHKKNIAIFGSAFVFVVFAFLAKTTPDNFDIRSRATPAVCASVQVAISPSRATYLPGETVTITVRNVPSGHEAHAHVARTNTNTQTSVSWAQIPISFNGTEWTGTWQIPSDIPLQEYPYNSSLYQEFFIAANIHLIGNPQFACTGNPDPGSSLSSLICDNCLATVISKPQLSGATIRVKDFYNINPGYSITYVGRRYDNYIDDTGTAIEGNFTARHEFEAPVALCQGSAVDVLDLPGVPLRQTKSDPWGYWGPSNPDPSKRTDRWSDGSMMIRFFVTDPDPFDTAGRSEWHTSQFIGSQGFKLYQGALAVNSLGTFNGSFVSLSLGPENVYYPPYLLAHDAIASSGVTSFSRTDSIYGTINSQDKNTLCVPRVKNNNHNWHLRSQVLTDADVLGTFSTIRSAYPGRPLIVLTYFEGYPEPNFREDWYLMEGVGVVGVDQAFFERGSAEMNAYLSANLMKLQTPNTRPHMSMRAVRAYVGGPLSLTVTQNEIRAQNANGLSYDGYLEYDTGGGNAATLINRATNAPIWLTNGVAVFDKTRDLPGLDEMRFRVKVIETPSTQETLLNYERMPWSAIVDLDGVIAPPATPTPTATIAPSIQPTATRTPTIAPTVQPTLVFSTPTTAPPVPTPDGSCPVGTVPSELGCIPTDVSGFVASYYGYGLSMIGGLAILLIMYGAYLILTSAGDSHQLRNGKNYIGYAIGGLLLAIFGYLFIEVILIDILHVPGF